MLNGKLIRGSEVQDFLRCRKRWHYNWVEGLKPKKPNGKLFFGTLVHKWLEVWYQGFNLGDANDAMIQLFNETDTSAMDGAELQELWTLAQDVVSNYYKTYRHEHNGIVVLATELQFAVPLGKGSDLIYTGTIDLVYFDKSTGKIYLMDHKTTIDISKYEKNAEMDRQISRYLWAFKQLQLGNGYVYRVEFDENVGLVANWISAVDDPDLPNTLWVHELGGFVYNIIKKEVPEAPKRVKGGLSVDKRQKTTYELYRQALLEIMQDGEEVEPKYAEMLDYLKEHPREFLKRIHVVRNDREIAHAMLDFYNTADDMYPVTAVSDVTEPTERQPLPANKAYRNPTNDCHWDCSYKDICKATLDGSDAQQLIDELYVVEQV